MISKYHLLDSIKFVVIPMFVFFFIIFLMVRPSWNKNELIKDNCKATSLVVIGNKGNATPVYDCSGVNLD